MAARTADDASATQTEGSLHVLTTGFVAKTNDDPKSKETHRYRKGEKFNPVAGLHDVEALIRAKVIGRKSGDERLVPSTALTVSQAAAQINQEDSPVLDLESQPFELAEAPKDDDSAE